MRKAPTGAQGAHPPKAAAPAAATIEDDVIIVDAAGDEVKAARKEFDHFKAAISQVLAGRSPHALPSGAMEEAEIRFNKALGQHQTTH